MVVRCLDLPIVSVVRPVPVGVADLDIHRDAAAETQDRIIDTMQQLIDGLVQVRCIPVQQHHDRILAAILHRGEASGMVGTCLRNSLRFSNL